MKLYVVLYDIHDQPPNKKSLERKSYHPALRCAREVIKAYKPHGILYGGDASELSSLNHWEQDKRLKMEGRRYNRDIESIKFMFDWMDEAHKPKEKIYLMGNHEEWVNLYINYHPEQEGRMDWVKETELIKRGFEVIPLNKSKQLGKALFIHGLYTNLHHAYKTSHIYPRTIFYSHNHDYQVHSFHSPIDHKEIRYAKSMGCLCDLAPSYGRNQPNRWMHLFGMLWLKDNGEFQMDDKIVIRGETIVNGRIFKG